MADCFLSPVIRGQRLEESLEYQQFVANVEEEEAWINEKMTLVASEDYGDTLAAIQVREAGAAACRLGQWLHSRREGSRPAAATVSGWFWSSRLHARDPLPLDRFALGSPSPMAGQAAPFPRVTQGPLGPSAWDVQQQEAVGLQFWRLEG